MTTAEQDQVLGRAVRDVEIEARIGLLDRDPARRLVSTSSASNPAAWDCRQTTPDEVERVASALGKHLVDLSPWPPRLERCLDRASVPAFLADRLGLVSTVFPALTHVFRRFLTRLDSLTSAIVHGLSARPASHRARRGSPASALRERLAGRSCSGRRTGGRATQVLDRLAERVGHEPSHGLRMFRSGARGATCDMRFVRVTRDAGRNRCHDSGGLSLRHRPRTR